MVLWLNKDVTEEQATESVRQLLEQLAEARSTVEVAQRRVAGLRKLIDGLVEIFPALEDSLPDDLDGAEAPRPRGAVAATQVLAAHPGHWYTVSAVLHLLDERGWAPESANPANAVRTRS